MVIYSESEPEMFDQVVIPLSAQITAIFNASEAPEYSYVNASPANVRAVNRAMLGVSQQFIIGSTPNSFSAEVLRRWAAADRDGRVEIIQELCQSETGA